MTISTSRPWLPSPAHLRAVAIGTIGVAASLLFRSPILLVLATPFAFVTIWSTATRPRSEPAIEGRLGQHSVREGEATAWTGTLGDVTHLDHMVAFAPRRAWFEMRPASGVVVTPVHRDDTTVTTTLPMRSTHWGHRDVGPINIVSVSSWGAFRSHALDRGHRLSTLPLPDVFDAAPRSRANGLVGLHRSSNRGDGGEFSGLRPFQTGDRLRRINWRRSLRTNELHVTATYADQDTHVALIVDALDDFGVSGGIDGAASSLDTTVRAAGAIAEHFLLRGDRVSLRVMSSRLSSSVPPASGSGHLRQILHVLASVEPRTFSLGLIRNPDHAIQVGTLAIMLSPLISPSALQRAMSIASHGASVAVIDTLPDDVHVDDDPTTELAWRIRLLERQRELRAIQRIGVPVTAWQGPGSLDPFLRNVARRSSAPRMARR